MFYLSWQISVMAVVPIPLFVLCGRLIGKRLQRLTREGMQLDAALGSMAPPVVVLDEATAHLDSQSEAAIQRALKTALAGRTSLVIAHRQLLAASGVYAELYRTQFAGQSASAG